MFESLAQTYSEVFAPEYFVLLTAVLLIVYEWRETPKNHGVQLIPRFGVLVFGWAVAFVIYESGPSLLPAGMSWRTDFMGILGLTVGILIIWAAWRHWAWGLAVRDFSVLLLGMSVVHLAIRPFWDVSSHVAYASVTVGYLTIVDRRFAPLLFVPVGMVFARPLAGAHSWPQSIGGLVLGAVALWALLTVRDQPVDNADR